MFVIDIIHYVVLSYRAYCVVGEVVSITYIIVFTYYSVTMKMREVTPIDISTVSKCLVSTRKVAVGQKRKVQQLCDMHYMYNFFFPGVF